MRSYTMILCSLLLSCTAEQQTNLNDTTASTNSEQSSADSVEGSSLETDEGSDDETPQISGKEYFDGQLTAKLSSCKRCHAPEETPVTGDRGPVTIFDYTAMKALLDQNTLLPMIRSQIAERPHPTSDPCLAGLNSSPCREVAKWWVLEFGDDPNKQADRPLPKSGSVTEISPDGIVTGWAINPLDQSQIITVNLYINGTLLDNLSADLDIFDSENPGGHGFIYELPVAYKNGERFNLVIKGVIDNVEKDLSESPFSFAALPKIAAGKTYFDANLRNQIIANCGCHGSSFTYDFAWSRLAAPLATENGSATNNQLYLKASGQNQHAGGNTCQGNQTCQGISEWWEAEFGAIP